MEADIMHDSVGEQGFTDRLRVEPTVAEVFQRLTEGDADIAHAERRKRPFDRRIHRNPP